MSILFGFIIAGLFVLGMKATEAVSFVAGAFYTRHCENHRVKQMMQIRKERASH